MLKTPPPFRVSRSSTMPNSLPGRKSSFLFHTHATPQPPPFSLVTSGTQHFADVTNLFAFSLSTSSSSFSSYLARMQRSTSCWASSASQNSTSNSASNNNNNTTTTSPPPLPHPPPLLPLPPPPPPMLVIWSKSWWWSSASHVSKPTLSWLITFP